MPELGEAPVHSVGSARPVEDMRLLLDRGGSLEAWPLLITMCSWFTLPDSYSISFPDS